MRWVRIPIPSLLVLASLAAAPSAGAATTWYASPNGNGGNSCTDPQHPCDPNTAVNTKPSSGDTVVFAGDQGPYGSPTFATFVVLNIKDGVTVTGAPGQPMPVWYSQVVSPNAAVNMEGSGSKLVDLDIEDVGSPFAQALSAQGSVDRVLARAPTTNGVGGLTKPGVTMSNSICAGQNGIFDFVG